MAGLEDLIKGTFPTKLLYLDNSYLTACDCEVLKTVRDGKNLYLISDATIFHPKAGGQPSDVGTVAFEGEKLEVKRAMGVWSEDGFHVIHFGKGNVQIGKAHFEIDWSSRYLYMKRHTAAHLLDHCLMEATGKKSVTLGSWLGDKPYVDYAGQAPSLQDLKSAERLENEYIEQSLPVTFTVVPAEQAGLLGAPNEERLPKSAKELRLVRIGDFEWIPCGGTHLNNVREIGKFSIDTVIPIDGGYRVYFTV
ncbi:MAG: hypothetical protein ACP5T2_01385 [Thermoprotei archaeon]